MQIGMIRRGRMGASMVRGLVRPGHQCVVFDMVPKAVLLRHWPVTWALIEAHEKLVAEGIRSRVVSMPSWDIFEHQPQEYQDAVLPPHVTARLAVEQASTFGWERYIGRLGRIIGMKTFGASAPLKELQRKFGFTPDSIVTAAKEQVTQGR